MDDNLITVCEPEDRVEQMLIAQLLREAGIRCIFRSNPLLLGTRNLLNMRIQVLPQHAVQAQMLITDFRAKTTVGALAVGERELSASPEEPGTPTRRGLPVWAILLVIAILLVLVWLVPTLYEVYQRWCRHY